VFAAVFSDLDFFPKTQTLRFSFSLTCMNARAHKDPGVGAAGILRTARQEGAESDRDTHKPACFFFKRAEKGSLHTTDIMFEN
jgi:hypothetical protein